MFPYVFHYLNCLFSRFEQYACVCKVQCVLLTPLSLLDLKLVESAEIAKFKPDLSPCYISSLPLTDFSGKIYNIFNKTAG